MSRSCEMSRSKERIRRWKARPALDVSIVLVLATLSLAVGRAEASGGVRVEANLRYEGGDVHGVYERLVEVPRGGLEVDLWSHPGSGATVRPGQRIELFFETNADCYVTVLSVDPAGRARRLFPARGDDGWIQAGSVYRLPDPHHRTDLVVTGPRGEERVFALASLEPMHDRYPGWWHDGPGSRSDYYEEDAFFRTGWVIGDPVYEFGIFCERVVPHPGHYDTYSSAYVTFRVGGWKPAVSCCSVCGGIREGGHGHTDVFVEIHWYDHHGHIDFRAGRKPVFLSASCVCDSRPRRATKWVHTASGWDRHDDKHRSGDRHHDDDRNHGGDKHRGDDRHHADDKHRGDDRHYADDRYRGDDGHHADVRREDGQDGRRSEDRRRSDDRDRDDARRRLVPDDSRGADRDRADRGEADESEKERTRLESDRSKHKQDRAASSGRQVTRGQGNDRKGDRDEADESREARRDAGKKGGKGGGRELGPDSKGRKSERGR